MRLINELIRLNNRYNWN